MERKIGSYTALWDRAQAFSDILPIALGRCTANNIIQRNDLSNNACPVPTLKKT
jgi:hypothetical protein